MKNEIRFHFIKFRNFLSFGNNWTEVDLERNRTVFIEGKNLDNPESPSSNGSGKSSIIAAIEVVLFDKNRFGLSKNDLINNINKTTMEIIIEFSANGDRYQIHRKRGKENANFLIKNGKDITPDSVINMNNTISKILGMSFSLFSKVILFSGSDIGFLDMSGPDRKKMIEELFKLSILSGKAKHLSSIIKESDLTLKSKKTIFNERVLLKEQKIKEYNDLQNKIKKWDLDNISSINSTKQLLEEILSITSSIDLEEQKIIINNINSYNNELQKVQTWNINHNKQLTSVSNKLEKYNSLDKEFFDNQKNIIKNNEEINIKILEINKKINEYNSLIKKYNLEKNNIKNTLKSLDESKCPYCHQHYSDINELNSKKDLENNKLIEIDKNIEENNILLQENTILLNELQKKIIPSKYKSISEIHNAEMELLNLTNELNKLNNEQCPYQSSNLNIDELLSKKIFNSIQEISDIEKSLLLNKQKLDILLNSKNPYLDIEIKGHDIELDSSDIDELQNQLNHQEVLYKLLTDKNSFIRKTIIGKTMPFLNNRINYYISKLNLPMKVVFNNDMSVNITQFDRVMNYISAGEKKKINLALSFSFRDVLYYLHSPIKLLVCDEVDSGNLDTHAVLTTIQLLKDKCKEEDIPVLVISHRPEFDGRMDEVLTVQRQFGFSTLR